MKRPVRVFRIASFVSIAAFLLISILHAIAYLSAFGTTNENYFNSGAILPSVSVTFALIFSLFGIVLAIQGKSVTIGRPPLPLASLLTALGYLAAAIVLWLSLDSLSAKLTTAVLLASSLGITASTASKKIPDAGKALLGFLPIVGCTLLAIVYYFERSSEMNAALKISVMAGVLLVMMYHIQKIRLWLGRPAPRLFIFFTFALLGVGALSAIPVPIAFFAGVFNRSETVTSLPMLASTLRTPECLAGALIILGACFEAAVQSFGITKATEDSDNTEKAPDTLEDCEEKA